MDDEHFTQIGLLIDGHEFVPQDIVDKHTPFATPPGADVQAVYVLSPSINRERGSR
jgi:hypothetical protein